MENHSFDNLLGMAPYQVPGREMVDGLTRRRGRLANFNPGPRGRVHAQHAVSPCQLARQADTGVERQPHLVRRRPQRRVRQGQRPDRDALLGQARPAVHVLARQALPDRSAVLLLDALPDIPEPPLLLLRHGVRVDLDQSGGTNKLPAANGTIWDRLDAHHVDYGVYYQDLPSWAIIPGTITAARAAKQHKFDQFYKDAAAGKLPAFTFLDPNYNTTSEENPQDIQVGEQFMARVVNALRGRPRGRTPRCSSPTTSTAATTTTCHRRRRSSPTTSRRSSAPAISARAMTAMGSACR